MVDYKEDFLQKLTAIHFGSGQWMTVQAAIPTIIGAVTVKVTFPDMSGGTPGFTYWNANAPATYPAGPLPITAALLKARLRTDAGASFSGFGEIITVGARNFVRQWIKLDNEMPKSTFRVRFDIKFTGGLGSTASLRVSTVQKNTMKPGLKTNTVAFGPSDEVHPNSTSTGNPYDFRVNPSTLAVTGPPQP